MTPLLLAALLAGQLPPFTARFEQVTVDSGRTDTVRGNIYFAAPWRVYYKVDYPLNQMISVVKNTMTIHYPDENLAFVIKTKTQVESPMSQQSLPAVNQDQTLSKMGFKKGQTTTHADTAFTAWLPRSNKVPFSRLTFGRLGRTTVFVEVLRQNNQPLMRTRLSGHVRADTFELPTRITTERWDTDGTYRFEDLTYANLSTATDFLYTLGRFALPPGTRTKTSNW